MTSRIADVVVLAPGFLGFDHFGAVPYFPEAIATAIRVALEERCVVAPSELAVVASGTVPAGSLARRQDAFSAHLQAIVREIQRGDESTIAMPMPRLHIIGHSAGGVDAELFMSPEPLERDRWSAEEDRIRQAVRSVVTVAAPLAGTGLAESALCKLLASEGSTPAEHSGSRWHGAMRGARQLAEVLLSATESPPKDVSFAQLIAGSLDDLAPIYKFVGSVLHDRGLLDDLRPATMSCIGARIRPDPVLSDRVRVARFLTVARREPKPNRTGKLFEILYALTARDEGAGLPEHRIDALNRMVESGRVRVIGATPVPLPITVASNDGVVNTARQVPPAIAGDLLGHVTALVVADHLDVLGGFPMTHPVCPGPEVDDYLSSGSHFRSPEFSELYRAVAAEIGEAIASHGATHPPRSAPRHPAQPQHAD